MQQLESGQEAKLRSLCADLIAASAGRSRLAVYLFPVAACAMASAATYWLLGGRAGPMYTLFFAGVFASAVYGGFRSGVSATAISVFCSAFFFAEPPPSVAVENTDELIRLVTFVFVGVSTSWVVGALAGQNRALRAAASIAEQKRALQTIRESGQRFRQITESLPHLVWTCRPDGECDYLSSQWCLYTGVPEQAQLGYRWLDQVHPKDREALMAAWNDVVSEGGTFDVEFRIRRHDGMWRWFKTRATPIRDHAGKVVKWFGSNTDIHDLKEAQKALSESEERFRALADNIAQLAWMANGKGWIFWYNQRWLDYTGTTLEEMQGCGWRRVHHPDHVQRVIDKIRQCFRRGEVWEDTFPLRGKDGDYRWFLSRAIPIRDENGKVLRWFGTSTDVTEQRNSEVRLRSALAEAEDGRRILDAMMDHIPLGITIAEAPDVTIRAVSRFGRLLIEKSNDELTELPANDYSDSWQMCHADGVTPATPEKLPLTRATVDGEVITEEEWVVTRKDGTRIPILCTAAPIRDKQGRIIGGVSGWQDMTQRKRAELAREQLFRQLEAERAKLRSVFTQAPAFMCILRGPNHVHDMANARYLEIIGRNDVVGRPIRDVMPEIEEQGYLELLDEVYRTGEPFAGNELPARLDRGHEQLDEIFVNLVFQPIFGGEGKIEGVLIHGVDVTQQVRGRQELIRAKKLAETTVAQLRATIDSMSEGLFVADRTGEPLLVNQSFLRIYGLERAASVADGLRQYAPLFEAYDINGTLVPVSDLPLSAVLRGETVVRREMRVRRTDTGREMILRHNGAPVRDKSGAVVMAVITVEDVTATKRAEEALIRSEKLASAGRMAATVAHEINNPLEAVMNSLYLISLDEALSAKSRGKLAIADEELQRVAHLTKQTLGFYRDNGVPREVDVADLVNSVVSSYAPRLNKKRVDVRTSTRGELRIYAAPGELRQVVSNLIANSIDALDAEGCLHLRVSPSAVVRGGSSGVRITIADTGSGIPSTNLKKIYEPFFTTKQDIGTGLGLWVTKQLVEKHGGSIRVRSKMNKGSVFSIFLPASAGVQGSRSTCRTS